MPLGAAEAFWDSPICTARCCRWSVCAGCLVLSEAPLDDAARVIVIDRGAPVGFVVDRIDASLRLPAEQHRKR